MRTGRRFYLPIDPWPQASLAERTAVGMVLTFLLLLPACAAGAVLFVVTTLATHVYWSYDLGASLHDFIAQRTGAAFGRHGRPAGPEGVTDPPPREAVPARTVR